MIARFARALVAAERGEDIATHASFAAHVGWQDAVEGLRSDIAALAADVRAIPLRGRPPAVKQVVLKLTLEPSGRRTSVCVPQDLHDRFVAEFGPNAVAALIAKHRGEMPVGQKRSGLVQADMTAALDAKGAGTNVVQLRR